ncbi:MAG: BamA/TamA family outer membrane protein [Sulfitobacter sp.]|nr:BamA/TamA family outer membrane protein [Sulfitobacter sp.]
MTWKTLWIAVLAVLLGLPLETAAEDEMKKQQKSKNYAVAPIVVSNPSIGTGAGATGMYFYDVGSGGEGQPRSSVQLMGAYTHTDSYFAGLMNSLHMLQDRVRSKAGLFHAKINNEYRDPLGGDADFATDVWAAFAQATYRIQGDWFLGMQGVVSDVQYRPDTPRDGDYLDRVGAEDTTAGGIGPVVSYDSRDNIHYPGSGTLFEVKGFYKPSSWGNEADYAIGDMAVNHYIGLTTTHILALRAYGRSGTENMPYSDKSRLGQGSDLRGFKSGEISARTLVAGQAEIRWQFSERWGAVAFGGLSKLWDDDLEALITEDIFYSGGGGIRYMINTAQKINFRVDAAVGNGDNKGIYFGIREAF